MEILFLALGVGVGLIPYFIKGKKVRKINQELIDQEKELKENIQRLDDDFQLKRKAQEAIKEFNEAEIENQKAKIETLKTESSQIETQLQNVQAKFDQQLEKIANEYKENEEACKKEYLKVVEDYELLASETLKKIDNKVSEQNNQLENFKEKSCGRNRRRKKTRRNETKN